jgi:REP element-mobilizing transposase RayT
MVRSFLTHPSRTWVNPSSEGKDRGLTSNYHFTQRVDVIKSSMPRKTRIDSPDAVHHAIRRGIARQKIFLCHGDRDDFLDRLGEILTEAKTSCYAWALIPNHFHLLLRTGTTPLPSAMRRLLTGYAVSHNLRHRRHGHLFQNLSCAKRTLTCWNWYVTSISTPCGQDWWETTNRYLVLDIPNRKATKKPLGGER